MKCAVWNCTNKHSNKNEKISFFRFPKENKGLQKWLKFCRRSVAFKPQSWRICIEHFKEEDIKGNRFNEKGLQLKRYLRPGAVPSINKNLSRKDPKMLKRLQQEMRREVLNCLSKNAKISNTIEQAEAKTLTSIPTYDQFPTIRASQYKIRHRSAIALVKSDPPLVVAADQLSALSSQHTENESLKSENLKQNPPMRQSEEKSLNEFSQIAELETPQIKCEELVVPVDLIKSEREPEPLHDPIEHVECLINEDPLPQRNVNVEGETRTPRTKFQHPKKPMNLQKRKTLAEIQVLKRRSNYLANKSKNLQVQRTLMLLQTKKLRMEIKKMQNDEKISS